EATESDAAGVVFLCVLNPKITPASRSGVLLFRHGAGQRCSSSRLGFTELRYELSDDAGTCGDSHLNHPKTQERLDGIRADAHALRNLFTGETLGKVLNGLHFAIGELISHDQITV